MIGRKTSLLLLALFCAGAAPADDARSRLFGKQNLGSGRPKQFAPILFEVDRQTEILASRAKATPTANFAPLLPNRVYLYYAPPKLDADWYYVLTDFEGNLPEPLEVVRIRSILSGKYLGAKRPGQRYIQIDKLRWFPTFRPEAHDLLTLTDPPYFRVEEFLPVVKFEKKADAK